MRHSSATSCVNLGLPPPEWVSLHQALLIRSEAWTPIPENVFRLIASLPPPDDLAEKRRLIIELATRRLLHRGELWHMLRVCADSRSATGVKLASKYQISSEFWEAKNVCFERSEVRLCEPPAEFNMNRVKGDFFKLAHIEILLKDLETCPLRQAKRTGGRPMKGACSKLRRMSRPTFIIQER
jgi:hypothetical protein